jgi:hypothetical protein
MQIPKYLQPAFNLVAGGAQELPIVNGGRACNGAKVTGELGNI